MNQEAEIYIYMSLYTKQITNKDLLDSTGNSTQYILMAYIGKESKKEWICVCTAETNTTFQINSNNIFKKKENRIVFVSRSW